MCVCTIGEKKMFMKINYKKMDLNLSISKKKLERERERERERETYLVSVAFAHFFFKNSQNFFHILCDDSSCVIRKYVGCVTSSLSPPKKKFTYVVLVYHQ